MALIAHTVQQGAGTGTTTTSAIDTTGASLLVAAVASLAIGPGQFTDSKTNVWHRITTPVTLNTQLIFLWCIPASVGSGHTFSSTDDFSSIAIQAWSSTSAIPYGTGSAGSGTTVQATNPTTPVTSGLTAVQITALASFGDGTYSVDSGFTISDQCSHLAANAVGVAMASKSSSAAESPTWTWPSSATNEGVTAVAAFILTGSISIPMMQGPSIVWPGGIARY